MNRCSKDAHQNGVLVILAKAAMVGDSKRPGLAAEVERISGAEASSFVETAALDPDWRGYLNALLKDFSMLGKHPPVDLSTPEAATKSLAAIQHTQAKLERQLRTVRALRHLMQSGPRQ